MYIFVNFLSFSFFLSFLKQLEKSDSIYEEPETDHIYEVCWNIYIFYSNIYQRQGWHVCTHIAAVCFYIKNNTRAGPPRTSELITTISSYSVNAALRFFSFINIAFTVAYVEVPLVCFFVRIMTQ